MIVDARYFLLNIFGGSFFYDNIVAYK